ncbi:MAG: hypothetical protein ACP5XB_06030 [Isosphaeraceae bacterium]
MFTLVVKRIVKVATSALLAAALCQSTTCLGQQPAKSKTPPQAEAPGPGNPQVPAEEIPPPPAEVPPAVLVPPLKTVPVRRDKPAYNYQIINTALLPRDKQGIWVLDFSFKPLRIKDVEIPGKGRRPVHYLYYKVVNRTGKPRMFVPQFIMVNEEGKRFEDRVIPEAIPLIQAREDYTIPLLGAVNIMGIIPPSTKEGVDDAVFGVAVWDNWDPKSDHFSLYVRGLSDGYKKVEDASGGKPTVKYKTLRIDFIRRGDERNISEKEIEFNDPPYEWVYW